MSRTYTAKDGTKYPLREAPHDMLFKVYKSDRRKAVIGDPYACVEARGICRNRDVLEAYIGSGRDAYVVFKATDDEPAHAWHFTISAKAGKIRDAFDQNKKLERQDLVLKKPAKSWQLGYRRASNARRREEVRNGAEVTHRGQQKSDRITRIGVAPRPRAPVSRGGNVNVAA